LTNQEVPGHYEALWFIIVLTNIIPVLSQMNTVHTFTLKNVKKMSTLPLQILQKITFVIILI